MARGTNRLFSKLLPRGVLVAVGAVLLLANECPRRLPPGPVTVVSSEEHTLSGRIYILEVLRSTQEPNAEPVLQIAGDGILISFHSSSGPYSPTVHGPTISFGGHTLEVLAAANEYLIDGASHQLPPPGEYSFSNGKFLTQFL